MNKPLRDPPPGATRNPWIPESHPGAIWGHPGAIRNPWRPRKASRSILARTSPVQAPYKRCTSGRSQSLLVQGPLGQAAPGPEPSGSHPGASREPSRNHPGAIQKPSGSYPGAIQELSGSHPGAIWKASGSHPGAILNKRPEQAARTRGSNKRLEQAARTSSPYKVPNKLEQAPPYKAEQGPYKDFFPCNTVGLLC